MSTVDNDRPPYVAWETRQVEDRNASIAAGHYVAKDVDFAVVTRPGSRDSIDKEALVWLSELREKSRKGELPARWYEAFKESYDFWKKGEEAPISGTPIKGWPSLSPAAQKTLIGAGIRTVEDLAGFSDSELSTLGTGALSFKVKAQSWLSAANGAGKIAEEIAAQKVKVAELDALVRSQADLIKTLQSQLSAPAKQAISPGVAAVQAALAKG
jgi:hypothetical protein